MHKNIDKNIDKKMDRIVSKDIEQARDEACEMLDNNKWFAFEMLSEFKKVNRKMFAIILILIGVLVISNGYWLYTFSQYDFINMDGDGINVNSIKTDTMEFGDINNGDKGENIEKEKQ